MPDAASFKELRQTIRTTRELNNVVNSLNRGGKASAFGLTQNAAGTISTKWEYREAVIAFSVQERRKAVERRKAGIETDAGILTGNMGRIQEYNLAPARVRPQDMTKVQMERLAERYREQARVNDFDRAISMYENYVRTMEKVGLFAAFPVAADRVASLILEMAESDPEFLKYAYETYDEELRIEWVYDDNAYLSLRMVTIRDGWERVYREWNARKTG